MEEQLTMNIKDFAAEVGVGVQTMYRLSKIEGFPLLSLGKKKRLVLVAPAKAWLLENWKLLDGSVIR